MRRAFHWMCGGVVLVAALAVSGLVNVPAYGADGEGEMKAKERAAMKGMLPVYYRDLVDPLQREAIYKIQDSYKGQLDSLAKQIKDIEAKRDAEIETLLRPDQKEKLAKMREDKAAADKVKADENKAKAEARKKAAAENAAEKPKKGDTSKGDTAKAEKS